MIHGELLLLLLLLSIKSSKFLLVW